MTPAACRHIQAARRAERVERAYRELDRANARMRYAMRTRRAEDLANAQAHLSEAERALSEVKRSVT